jgi:hypothetical protein
MINSQEFQSLLVNLQDPNAILKSFMGLLKQKGANYDQAKTLAMFAADSKALITGLSSVSLFGTQYPASEHFLIIGIRVLTGTGASPANTVYTPGVTEGTTQNSLLNILNNGSVEIKDMPLSIFPLSTGNSDTNAGFISLFKPILWQGQTTLSVVINQATPTATATSNIDVQLIGLKLI